MKKMILLVLMMIVVSSVVVEAKGKGGSIEIVGGAKVAKLDYALKINGNEVDWSKQSEAVIDNLSKPTGVYLGGIYWVTNNKGIEIGVSSLGSSFSGTIDGKATEKTNEFIEIYGKYNYQANQYFRFNAGLTYCSFSEEDKIAAENFSEVVEEGSGVGLNVGAGMKLPVTDNLSLTGEVNYSLLNIMIDQGYDHNKDKLVRLDYDREYVLNPLAAKIGISYRF
ncbi:outer membrane beta-barrel protein [Halanaerobacter jeridensis]|uniref:Outer membrane protein W n=1 Tax=Halanaerobacter jeridensis TaxID=706427 RepID=A0A938XZ13_9FIRM|nr:outer membrane beta-barrel protein [Halanaerobacter jeridensis]MBM7557910.1 outer membrane protein W [Halanaerobacter jeridensis]